MISRKKHKALSPKVIKYIQKMYTYALRQNQGNPNDIRDALSAIVPHCFGCHEKCAISWCGFLIDPSSYKHKSLPHGRDLEGDQLKQDLTPLFNEQIKGTSKLSYLGSSQANESINMTVSSKASKRINYSESRSLTS